MAEYHVPGPDGKTYTLRGPEGLPMEVLQMDLQKHLALQSLTRRPAPPPPEPERTGVFGEAMRSGRSLLSSGRTGIEALLGDPNAAVGRGVDRGEAIAADYSEPPSLAAVQEAYRDEGLWEAIKEGAGQVPRLVAQQAPVLAQLAAAGKIGASLPLPPQAKAIAGAVTAIGSFIPSFAGSNLERRAEEQVDAGEELNLNVPGAYATAVGQASAEALGGAAVLGKNIARSLIGAARDVPQEVAERELKKLAGRGTLESIARAGVRGAAAETPTEIAQQMLERNYAGLPLADEEALREYGEAAYAAGISGGAISGTLGSRDGARARRQLEERQTPPTTGQDGAGADQVGPNTFTAPVFNEAGEQSGESTFSLRGNVVEETSVGDDGEQVTLPVYEGDRASEFFEQVKATAEDGVIAEDVERMFYEFNQMDTADVAPRPEVGVAPSEGPELTGAKRVRQRANAVMPNLTTPEAQQMLSEPITVEEVEATGVKYPAKKWLNENVIGKNRRQLQKLVTDNPALLSTPGARAQLLQALIAPKTPPTMEDVRTPALAEQTTGLTADEVPGAVRVEAGEQAPVPELQPSEAAMPGEQPAQNVRTPDEAVDAENAFDQAMNEPDPLAETAPGVVAAPDGETQPEAQETPQAAPATQEQGASPAETEVDLETAPGVAAPQMVSQPKQESAATSELNRSFARALQGSRSNQELLGNIANDKLVPQPLRNLARQLRSAAPNVNVPVEMVELEGNDVVGTFVPEERGGERVLLDPRANSVPQSFLHEYIHALTYRGMRQGKPAGRRINALYEQFKKKYPDVRNPDTGDMEPAFYGLTDPFEFVSEGLTNAQFQSVLKRQNLWDRFVDAIRAIVGLPSTQNKVIDELLDLTKELAVGADARAIAKRNEVVDTLDNYNTPAGNKEFLMKQGSLAASIAQNPDSADFKKKWIDSSAFIGKRVKQGTFWGLHMNSLNDLVQNTPFLKIFPDNPNQPKEVVSAYNQFKQAMSNFSRVMHEGEGAREQFVQAAAPIIDRQKAVVSEMTADQIEAFKDLVYGGTEAYVDLRYDVSRYKGDPEKVAAYNRLKKEFWTKIGPKGQQLYRQRRQVFDNQFKEIVAAVQAGVESMADGDKMLATAITNKFTQELLGNKMDGYEPLTRPDGEWKLTYITREKGAPEVGFQKFTSKADRDRMADLLEADGQIMPGTVRKADPLDQDFARMLNEAPSDTFVGQVLTILNAGNASAETKNTILQAAAAMSPSSAMAKRLMARKETPGYVRDPFNAFNQSVVGTGRQLENLRHGARVREQLRGLQEAYAAMGSPEELGTLMRELADRTKFATNPTLPAWSNFLKTATFAYTLAFNLSSPVVDTLSLATITYSHLSKKYGMGAALSSMRDAAKAIMGSGYSTKIESLVTRNLTDAELNTPEMKKMMADAGITGRDFEQSKAFPSVLNNDYNDPNLDPDTADLKFVRDEMLATGHSQRFSTLRESVEVGEQGLLSAASAYMGVLMHGAERFKREVTVVAQFKAELAKLRKEGTPITDQVKVRVAREALNDSLMLNGGSSALTKPGFTQSPGWSVVGMYKQYGTLIYYLQYRILNNMLRAETDPEVKRQAWKQWLVMSGTSAALAGARGIPMMGIVFALYNLAAGDDEDDAETAMRKAIGNGFTEGIFSQALNMNIGPRIEHTNMLIRDTQLPDQGSVWDKAVVLFGGPTFGTVNRVLRGLTLMQEGNFERGVENVMPVFFANLLKTGRFATEGARTIRGDAVVEDFNPGALFSQALGFAPADYARSMALTTKATRVQNEVNKKRDRLYDRAYTAYRLNDTAGYLDVMQDIVEFNRTYGKQYPKRIIRTDTLMQSIRTRDRNTQRMIMGRLPGSGFEGMWADEVGAWGF